MTMTNERKRHLSLLGEKFPSIAAAASEIIKTEAVLRLPKGTEHFMSDLHGESDAFTHILNSASGVIREKIDAVLYSTTSPAERAHLATLIYYPEEKLPELKAAQDDLEGWYRRTLMQLIDICRFVSSKHTRELVRSHLNQASRYVLDELLHAHFEDHNKELYYGEIITSIIIYGRADAYIIRLCELIKLLVVDHLHIVGDIFDRGPRPDRIMDNLIDHHSVDIQWGNHDVLWMGAASGSPICILTVLKNTLSYNNSATIERGYGIGLRSLDHLAEDFYKDSDMKIWMPKTDNRDLGAPENLPRIAQMHKAVTIMMFKVEAEIIRRNPDFQMQGRDFLNHIDFEKGTVECYGKTYPLKDTDFPTIDPANPTQLSEREEDCIRKLVRNFRDSKLLQRHIQFIYSHGSAYKVMNNNLLYHGAVPMTKEGNFAGETFKGISYSGKALFDYCDKRARDGYFAPEGSRERQEGQDFLWYLWCGQKSPIFGRSAMTTFERLYIEDKDTHKEVKDPYYSFYNEPEVVNRILKEFNLEGEGCHVINGHVPVKAVEGENPVKGGGKLVVIDGGFCRAYQDKTGIAGYTLVYNSRGLVLRTHQPFESKEVALHQDEDIASRSEYIYNVPRRLLVRDTDRGKEKREYIKDLCDLVMAYEKGILHEK